MVDRGRCGQIETGAGVDKWEICAECGQKVNKFRCGPNGDKFRCGQKGDKCRCGKKVKKVVV